MKILPCLVASVLAFGCCDCPDAIAQSQSRPNILFILTEDQGPQIGHTQTPAVLTPNMDSLARSGTYFRNAYVAYPVCSASKAALMTSLYGHANGILNNTMNFHAKSESLKPDQTNNRLYNINRVRAEVPTLIERHWKDNPMRKHANWSSRRSPTKVHYRMMECKSARYAMVAGS